jgi:hypothetical protein
MGRLKCNALKINSAKIASGKNLIIELREQKRDNEAMLVEQQFQAAWKDATVQLRIEDL